MVRREEDDDERSWSFGSTGSALPPVFSLPSLLDVENITKLGFDSDKLMLMVNFLRRTKESES